MADGELYRDIRAALEVHLAAWPDIPTLGGVLQVQWENKKFAPTQGQPWVQSILFFNSTGPFGGSGFDVGQRSLGGPRPITRIVGYLDVRIFVPADIGSREGPAEADLLAGKLMNYYRSGQQLGAGDMYLTTLSPDRDRGQGREAVWYHVPVYLPWVSHSDQL